MRIRWTAPAADDLEQIADYIGQHNPAAARTVTRAIVEGISGLQAFPNRGRPGERSGTRELVVARLPAYVVVYSVRGNFVDVLHIWHGAQDWR